MEYYKSSIGREYLGRPAIIPKNYQDTYFDFVASTR